MAQPLRMKILLKRLEIVTAINHVSGYGNTIVDEREKNRWLKSNIDHYYQGFSEQSYSSWWRWLVNRTCTCMKTSILLYAL